MECTRIQIPGGITAIVCGPKGKRKRCTACGELAVPKAMRECDWRVPSRGSGTCDALICERCATSVGPDRDLCPEHAKAWAVHPANPANRRVTLTNHPMNEHIPSSSTRNPTA